MSNNADLEYLKLAEYILDNGIIKRDRTRTGTISVFGTRMEFDLNEGFPLLTTKEVDFENIVRELLWFISGNTNITELTRNGVNIWNKDAHRGYKDYIKRAFGINHPTLSLKEFVHEIKTNDEFASKYGDLGKTYGYMWRYKGEEKGIDPLHDLINQIKTNPDSRRHLIVSWDASTANELTLPPCHPLFQFYIANNKISCQFYMRSNDFFLGNCYNIASYALLTMMIAKECNLELGRLIFIGGDTHLYLNHIEQIKQQLIRKPRELPNVILNPDVKSVFDYTVDDFILMNYNPHPAIKGEMST